MVGGYWMVVLGGALEGGVLGRRGDCTIFVSHIYIPEWLDIRSNLHPFIWNLLIFVRIPIKFHLFNSLSLRNVLIVFLMVRSVHFWHRHWTLRLLLQCQKMLIFESKNRYKSPLAFRNKIRIYCLWWFKKI